MKAELIKSDSGSSVDVSSSRFQWLTRLQQEIDDARALIENSDVPSDVNDLRLRAEAITAAASRLKSEDLALAACEVQSRAERRLGELRSLIGESGHGKFGSARKFDYAQAKALHQQGLTFAQIAERLNVSPATVRLAARRGWPDVPQLRENTRQAFDLEIGLGSSLGPQMSQLARIPIDVFEKVISDLKTERRHATRPAIIRRASGDKKQRIEKYIYRLSDGRYQIRVTRGGHAFTRTLRGARANDIDYARREVAVLKGALAPVPKASNSKGLDAIAADTQKLMQRLDLSITAHAGMARQQLRYAYGHAMKMEQALIRAINEAKL